MIDMENSLIVLTIVKGLRFHKDGRKWMKNVVSQPLYIAECSRYHRLEPKLKWDL